MKIYNIISAPKLNNYQSFKGDSRGYINIPLIWDQEEEEIYLNSLRNNSHSNDIFCSEEKSKSNSKNYAKGALATGAGLSLLPSAIEKVGNTVQSTVNNLEEAITNSTETISQSVARLKELKHSTIEAWEKGHESVINKLNTENNAINNTSSSDDLNNDYNEPHLNHFGEEPNPETEPDTYPETDPEADLETDLETDTDGIIDDYSANDILDGYLN